MKRTYEQILEEHLSNDRQMLFLSGPRQVGKTTVSLQASSDCTHVYLNWDKETDRTLIINGTEAVAEAARLNQIQKNLPIVIFDEIHKYSHWKLFLKGFFDSYEKKVYHDRSQNLIFDSARQSAIAALRLERGTPSPSGKGDEERRLSNVAASQNLKFETDRGIRIVVTGSARLDVYKRGGDSLMGRYFLYRLHPLSIREIVDPLPNSDEIQQPLEISAEDYAALMTFGGFPEPYLKRNAHFWNRWKRLRTAQLFQEDIRDLSRIQELSQIQLLAEILTLQAGQLVNYSSLASKVRVANTTVQRWIETLKNLYYCFTVQPWSKNISRSLLKEPKIYLWNWALIEEEGARHENFVASHLLKATQFWTDRGFGEYGLYFLRDKDQREVDFLVTKNDEPWFLVEVKSSYKKGISKSLYHFQKQTSAQHAFQVVFDLPYVQCNCFEEKGPIIVPATTFLSQLV